VTRMVPSFSIRPAVCLAEAIASIVERYSLNRLILSSGGDAMSCNASSETMTRTLLPALSCILIAQPNMFTDRIGSAQVPVRAMATLSHAEIILPMLSEALEQRTPLGCWPVLMAPPPAPKARSARVASSNVRRLS
jgi:hypothetical protein